MSAVDPRKRWFLCQCRKHKDLYCDDEDLNITYPRSTVLFQTICDGFTHLLPNTKEGQNETDETNCEQWPCNNIYTRCDGFWHCRNGIDEINCDESPLLNCSANHHICVSSKTNELICLPIEKADDGNIDCIGGADEPTLCRNHIGTRFDEEKSIKIVYQVHIYVISHVTSTRIPINQTTLYYQPRCHRGLNLQVWLNKEKNLTTNVCLCPPSYYGDICQYQNQRVSLTLRFRVTSDSIQIPFIIIISLIDDSNERIIHSYQQFTYLSMEHCQRKFNVYLLYSIKPKDPMKNYLIHTDIYEKHSLNYRGSNQSATISKTLNSSDRCLHINEILHKTIANYSLLRRIKYYHLPRWSTCC